MKRFIFFGLFLSWCLASYAQTIPTNYQVKVSFDVETTTFKQMPKEADINKLTDFEKLSFTPTTEIQSQEHYLDQSNNITDVINYKSLKVGETEKAMVMKKLIIANGKSFAYDKNGKLLEMAADSETALANWQALKSEIQKENFWVLPKFSPLTDEQINEAKKNGFQIESTENSFKISGEGMEFSHDSKEKLIEQTIYEEGQPYMTLKQYYNEGKEGDNIPAFKVETSYDYSTNGLLIETVTVQKFSNFTKISK